MICQIKFIDDRIVCEIKPPFYNLTLPSQFPPQFSPQFNFQVPQFFS